MTAAAIASPTTNNRFSAEIGALCVIRGVDCIVSQPGEVGHLIYGAHELRAPGRYRVSFWIALSDSGDRPGDPVCATLDITTRAGSRILGERFLSLSELTDKLECFEVEFDLQEPRELEYRVFNSGQAGLIVEGTPFLTRISDTLKPTPLPSGSSERVWQNEREFLDGYLRNVSGVIHVGANIGQERQFYRVLGLDVVWVEGFPDFYERLINNIAGLDRQRAVRALLTDREGEEYDFKIANNSGSSSIFEMDKHSEVFPDIEYIDSKKIISTTFETMLNRENISLDNYQALTLDVEGAELMVLKGAGPKIREFKYIKAEVADFTPRVGSPVTNELDDFLRDAGFEQLARRPFAYGPKGNGTYWDIVWKRTNLNRPIHQPGIRLPIIMSASDLGGLDRVHDG